MTMNDLPEPLRGEWIWTRAAQSRLDAYVFFRREFILSQTPTTAELWISARTFFQLYVNGRHVAWGPPPCPGRDSYVLHLDVSFLLQTGANVIAVLAHNTTVARYAMRRSEPGLWCQLNIDGSPTLWTDRTWQVLDGECFQTNRPRRSRSLAFTEKVDMGTYPHGWTEPEYNAVRWRHPDLQMSLVDTPGRLRSLPSGEISSGRVEFERLAIRGECRQVCAVSWVSFQDSVESGGPGVYAAQTHIYAAREMDVDFELYCNDPYVLVVNGRRVKSQGIVPLVAGTPLDQCRPPCFGQCEQVDADGEMNWRAGWNTIQFFTQCESGTAGATLVFPGLDANSIKFSREQRREGAGGWIIAGPLTAPLGAISSHVNLSGVPAGRFLPRVGEPVNEGAYLMSYAFQGESGGGAPPETIELRQGQYVILDLGRTLTGCPEFVIEGPDGAAVDVVCSEQLVDDQLAPCGEEGRNFTDSILLGPKSGRWRAVFPRGLRYLMLVARHVPERGVVTISDPAVLIREEHFGNVGEFECSDRRLVHIWEVGRRTLQATLQGTFIDSPTRDFAQYITDAMIQSWAAYHVFGAFHTAQKSIAEFADAQYETGEMPAVAPSDVYLNMPDYALLWPVWLQRHYLYTGDIHFVQDMLPALRRLFSYFSHIAVTGRDILADLGPKYNAYCFLDHGEIDRRGIVTGLNALYCRALLAGSWLFAQLEDERAADIAKRRAARVAGQIRELCWDEERGLFVDGWHDGGMSEYYSWQSNILAVYGGIARPEQVDRILEKVIRDDPPLEPLAAAETNNPYFQYFVLQVAFALERHEWAFKLIKWYWGAMLDQGATTWWELFDPGAHEGPPPDVSCCHGYGASPNAFLITELVGVQPAAPGFTRVFFKPYLPGAEWVKACVPTPYGRISVEWGFRTTGELEVVLDANYPLEVVPVLDPSVAETAIFHISDDIAVLAAEEAAAANNGKDEKDEK